MSGISFGRLIAVLLLTVAYFTISFESFLTLAFITAVCVNALPSDLRTVVFVVAFVDICCYI